MEDERETEERACESESERAGEEKWTEDLVNVLSVVNFVLS